jgi:hypothetical protein
LILATGILFTGFKLFDLAKGTNMRVANNSMAMVATISAVALFASLIGFFDPATCIDVQAEGWTSCEAIAEQRRIGSWSMLGLAIIGFAVSLVRRKRR